MNVLEHDPALYRFDVQTKLGEFSVPIPFTLTGSKVKWKSVISKVMKISLLMKKMREKGP